MTITTTTNRWAYDGNGSTTDFSYTNLIFAASDLKVYVDGALQTEGTHYSVSGVGAGSGGTVSFVTAPADGAEVVIVRQVPYTQLIDYAEGGAFPAASHEDALDKATVLAQQLLDQQDRSLRLPLSEADPASFNELPAKATRAGKFLAFDAAGQAIASSGDAGSVAVSTFMETVLDDTTAGAALTTLGVSAFAQTLLDDATAAAARTTLDAQQADAELSAIAGLTSAADKLPYFTGSGTAALADFTAAGRALVDDADAAAQLTTLGVSAFAQTLLDDADAATARTTLGAGTAGASVFTAATEAAIRSLLDLEVGTDVQAHDAELDALAGLTSAADKLPYFTGSGTAALADFTAAGRALVDDADADAQLTTLGIANHDDITIDSSGRVIVGGTAHTDDFGTSITMLQLQGTGSLSGLGLGHWSADTQATQLRFYKSRNAAIGSHTIVQADDDLGVIQWFGDDGTDEDSAGFIRCKVDAVSAGSVSGRLELSMSGSIDVALDSNGRLIVNSDTSIAQDGSNHAEVQIHVLNQQPMTVARYGNNASGPNLVLAKDRATSIGGTSAATQSDDQFGVITGFGIDANGDPQSGAQIILDQNGIDGTAPNLPGAVRIKTKSTSTMLEGVVVRSGTIVEFPNISTTGSAANAFLDSGSQNRLLRSTSSLRYKTDVRPMNDAEADLVLALQAIAFRSLAEADDPDAVFHGFAAEDVDAVAPEWAIRARPTREVVTIDAQGIRQGRRVPDMTKDPQPDGWQPNAVIAALQHVVKRHEARIAALEAA